MSALEIADAPLRLRNAVARAGSEPSEADTLRHVALAKAFSRDLVRAAWNADNGRLSLAEIIVHAPARRCLVDAERLLTSPASSGVSTEARCFDLATASIEPRRALAVGLAMRVWTDTVGGQLQVARISAGLAARGETRAQDRGCDARPPREGARAEHRAAWRPAA